MLDLLRRLLCFCGFHAYRTTYGPVEVSDESGRLIGVLEGKPMVICRVCGRTRFRARRVFTSAVAGER